jgi:hypothetical protein
MARTDLIPPNATSRLSVESLSLDPLDLGHSHSSLHAEVGTKARSIFCGRDAEIAHKDAPQCAGVADKRAGGDVLQGFCRLLEEASCRSGRQCSAFCCSNTYRSRTCGWHWTSGAARDSRSSTGGAIGTERPRSWHRSMVGGPDTRKREDGLSRYHERHRARGRRGEDAVRRRRLRPLVSNLCVNNFDEPCC